MAGPERVVVAGAGIGGLATALLLGRAGHAVTLLERDALPVAGEADDAFGAPRPGASQVHQTHGFLARIRTELRSRLPDVLEALHAVGCTTLPTTAALGEPRPGDEDLSVLIVRRTTLEWVLRRAVLTEPAVEVRTGAAVTGLAGGGGPVPVVTGVTLDDGATVGADFVVAATGRRGAVPQWLGRLGVAVPERHRDSGLMYLTRWYRLPPERALDLDPKLGGDLGFVKYLAVPGDGGTLSITLAVRTLDRDLRAVLSTPEGFEAACRALPGPDQFFAAGPLEPVGGVRPMGGLLNRARRFVDDDGDPTVVGFHVVGDAHTCTNPLYGRGCSLAVVQAGLLADADAAHPGDPAARASAYEAACARQVEPWYEVSVQMDEMGADPSGFSAGTPGGTGAGRVMAAIMAAAATDPVIGRGLMRFWNLLATPSDLMADQELVGRIAAVAADPDAHPVPAPTGPSRSELLELLSA